MYCNYADLEYSRDSVRTAQRPPPSWRGTILDNPEVSGACVVGLSDDYSGELPLASVTSSAAAAERLERNPAEAAIVRVRIAKASGSSLFSALAVRVQCVLIDIRCCGCLCVCSTSRT